MENLKAADVFSLALCKAMSRIHPCLADAMLPRMFALIDYIFQLGYEAIQVLELCRRGNVSEDIECYVGGATYQKEVFIFCYVSLKLINQLHNEMSMQRNVSLKDRMNESLTKLIMVTKDTLIENGMKDDLHFFDGKFHNWICNELKQLVNLIVG